jgi:hypothetical protein
VGADSGHLFVLHWRVYADRRVRSGVDYELPGMLFGLDGARSGFADRKYNLHPLEFPPNIFSKRDGDKDNLCVMKFLSPPTVPFIFRKRNFFCLKVTQFNLNILLFPLKKSVNRFRLPSFKQKYAFSFSSGSIALSPTFFGKEFHCEKYSQLLVTGKEKTVSAFLFFFQKTDDYFTVHVVRDSVVWAGENKKQKLVKRG